MKKALLAFLLLVAPLAPPVHAQQTFGLTPTFSKTLSVTTTTGNVQLGAGSGTTVVVWNGGANAAFVAVGTTSAAAATVAGSMYLPPGSCVVLNAQPSWYLAAITGSSTTTLYITQGAGQTACSFGGVGAASGGGGGAATIADGADVTQGAIADAAATAGSTGTLSAKLRLMTTQLATLNTTLGTPLQAGGAVTASSATAPISTMNSATANSGINAALAGVFDDAAPTSITENSFGFARMSANRNLYGTVRDAAGNERGANVSAANELQVGSSTLALASNQTATQAPVAPATATATKSDLVGCQATSAAINPTTGQQAAIDCDLNNNILVSAGGAPNIATAQVSVTTGNISVAALRALRRAITITNVTGTSAIYCGNTGVSTSTGTYLGASAGSAITLNTTAAVFCTVAATTQTVTVVETY